MQGVSTNHQAMAANTKIAWRAFDRGDVEEATSLFARAAQEASSHDGPHTQQGLFFLKLDRYTEAVECFERARVIGPKNPAPLFFLALAQELEGQTEKSQQSLAELRELSPHHQGISSLTLLAKLRDGDPSKELASFGFGPPDHKKASVSLANRFAAGLGLGNPDWLPADLSSSNYLLGPILVEIESKLHPLEVPTLEHFPPLLPEDLDTFKVKRRSFSQELSTLRGSLKAGPHLKKGKTFLEKAYGLTDRKKQHSLLSQAAKFLRLARKIDPHGFRVSYHLGEAYIFLAKGEPGKPYSQFKLLQAQNSFLESANKEGVNPYLLFYLAYIQHLLGRPNLAVRYYQEATKKFEKLPEAHYGQGQCQLLLGNKNEAKRLFLKASNSDLALARERLDLFANLLAEFGPDVFDKPIPVLGPEPDKTSTDLEPELGNGLGVPDEPSLIEDVES